MGGGCSLSCGSKKTKLGCTSSTGRNPLQIEKKPIGRTKFYEALEAGNFREIVEMAGLCNLCTEFGAKNFEGLENLTTAIENHLSLTCNKMSDMRKRVKHFKGYLISEFPKNLQQHSHCSTHCINWYISPNPRCDQHDTSCYDCNERWDIFRDLENMINQTTNNENKTAQLNRLKEIQNNLSQYICHIVRSVYQRRQFHADVRNLKPGETVLVVDYMMKLLFRKLYKPQSFTKKIDIH